MVYNAEVSQRFYEKHRAKLLQKNAEWFKNHPNYHKKAYEKEKIRRKRIRIEALKIVGNGKIECSNCGFNKNMDFLEINHINKKSKIDKQYHFYQLIIDKIRKTDDLNILCKLCNWYDFYKKKFDINFDIILRR